MIAIDAEGQGNKMWVWFHTWALYNHSLSVGEYLLDMENSESLKEKWPSLAHVIEYLAPSGLCYLGQMWALEGEALWRKPITKV